MECVNIFLIKLSYSQKISGTIYSDNQPISGIQVFNETTKKSTISNDAGTFRIGISLNDTLLFLSPIYEEKKIVVIEEDLRNGIVVVLVKRMISLDEVVVEGNHVFKDFDENQYNNYLQDQLIEDRKNNPLNYMVRPGIQILPLLQLLFRKKKSKSKLEYMTSEELEVLFQEDSFFNQKFLEYQLGIVATEHYLFIDYCASTKLDKSLLNKDNHFLLLNKLMQLKDSYKKQIKK